MTVKFLLALALLSSVLLSAVQARAEIRYTAKVYENESKSKLLYTYKSESTPVGDTYLVNNQFTYPDGKVASHEEITFTKDGQVTLYKQHQAQLGADGSIEIGGGQAKFTWKRDGKEKTATEKADSDFIIGSQIPLMLEAHWGEIMKGDTLKKRLAVLERLETVGFSFSKEGDATIDGKKSVIVKMKPSSLIISAVVKPLHFYMSEDGKALLEIRGRTTVKRDQGNGKFTDLDADVVYTKGPAAETAPTHSASGGNSK